MNRSLIISKLRIELRRKGSGYPTEKIMVRIVKKFMDEMSLTHSSQIREWHKDLFISRCKNKENLSSEELLQITSSLLFLYNRVLKYSTSFMSTVNQSEPEVFRITG